MVCRYTVVQVAKRFVFICVALIGLVSCGTVYELYAPPNSTIHRGIEGNSRVPPERQFVLPDDYRYDPMPPIIFRATKEIDPPEPWYLGKKSPRPMSTILKSDTWRVTHRIDSKFLIYSDSFQSRQKKLRQKFGSPYLFHIYIDANGVASGWALLLDRKIVVSKNERKTILHPRANEGGDWPTVPLFARN